MTGQRCYARSNISRQHLLRPHGLLIYALHSTGSRSRPSCLRAEGRVMCDFSRPRVPPPSLLERRLTATLLKPVRGVPIFDSKDCMCTLFPLLRRIGVFFWH